MKQFLFEILRDKEEEFRTERFDFKIPSLRVSLVSRCNENCFYCHNEGIPRKASSSILTGDVLSAIYSLREYGLKKVKFTGGEPLLFKDLKNLLYKVKHIAELDIFITTNGTLLKKRLKDLSPNMVNKISVSLDTLDRETYKFITGRDLLGEVLEGLDILKKNGYDVEIDAVLLKGLNTNKKCLHKMISYCANNEFNLQFIELSDKAGGRYYGKYYADPVKTLGKAGIDFNPGKANDRQFFNIDGATVTLCRSVRDLSESSGGTVGRCGGLRLTPDGFLKDFFY